MRQRFTDLRFIKAIWQLRNQLFKLVVFCVAHIGWQAES